MPNSPITATTKLTPLTSSSIPMVRRTLPDTVSMPTAAMAKPMARDTDRLDRRRAAHPDEAREGEEIDREIFRPARMQAPPAPPRTPANVIRTTPTSAPNAAEPNAGPARSSAAVARHRIAVEGGRDRRRLARNVEQNGGDRAAEQRAPIHAREQDDRGDRLHAEGQRQHSETPFGAPSPGSTPTRMPSSTPMSISAICGTVIAMVKPCSSSFEIFHWPSRSEAERRGEGAVRQRHLEHALEHHVEGHRRRRRAIDGARRNERFPFWQRQTCEARKPAEATYMPRIGISSRRISLPEQTARPSRRARTSVTATDARSVQRPTPRIRLYRLPSKMTSPGQERKRARHPPPRSTSRCRYRGSRRRRPHRSCRSGPPCNSRAARRDIMMRSSVWPFGHLTQPALLGGDPAQHARCPP